MRRKNTNAFIEFLEHLFEKAYPDKPLMLAMDNAPYHKSKAALAMLSLYQPRVVVFWLPPYCSMLNPIERFWRHMKDVAKANTLFATIEDMLERTEELIKAQKEPGHKLRLNFSHG